MQPARQPMKMDTQICDEGGRCAVQGFGILHRRSPGPVYLLQAARNVCDGDSPNLRS